MEGSNDRAPGVQPANPNTAMLNREVSWYLCPTTLDVSGTAHSNFKVKTLIEYHGASAAGRVDQ